MAPDSRGPARVWMWLGSAAAHAAAFFALSAVPGDSTRSKRTRSVAVDIVPLTAESESAPSQPETPPAAVEETVPIPARERPAVAKAEKPQQASPKEEPPAAAEETAVDFTGVTLTNDGAGDSWASATGNGGSMDAPIGKPGLSTGRNRSGVLGGEPGGTGKGLASGKGDSLVPVGDLSRRPEPPNLNDVLEKNYPADARAQGIEGLSVVKARIGANGEVSTLRVISESHPGFGTACRKTLIGSRWSPPLDRLGQPVPTEITYTCRFEVRY